MTGSAFRTVSKIGSVVMTGLSARAVIFAKRLRTEFDLFLLSLDRNLLEYGLPQKVRRVSLFGKRILSSGKRILLRLHRNLGRAKPTSIQTPRHPSHGAEIKKIVIEFAPRPRNNLPVNTANSVPPLPIVFIHYKNKDYLKFSLAQAKVSNPHSTVYLLGDSSNNCYDFVEHHYFSDYFEGAAKFSKIYRHFNTTSPYYELLNFQRWFILREFLRAQKLDRCLYLDSDTMLYAELSDEQKKFEQFYFTLAWHTCGSTFFLNKIEALDDFCEFLVKIYTKEDRYHYDKMLAHYAVRKKNGLNGGACDMTAFGLYSGAHLGEIGETSQIIDDSVYDPGIRSPQPGFEMSDGVKNIFWKDGDPYGIHLITGRQIKFNSLHCQGTAKVLMGDLYQGPDLMTID